MSEWDSARGYSGAAFDQQVGRMEKTPLEKVKEQFWTAKQVVLQKLGKKEDGHLIASDAELDAKLELFASIKTSSGSLMRIANRYQKIMHEISKEEYAMGQFLKRHGEQDPSRAGTMLNNVAKAFVISAQKRMDARAPLIRLAQDTLTYRRCAVTDTERKIAQMEEGRTEYRGALLWMKNVSEELDPDTYKQLERFRKVQSQVRVKKDRFDSHKLDTLQKIDLLAISRLNMLSQSLSPYGSTMHEFYGKASTVFGSVVAPTQSSQEAELRIMKSYDKGDRPSRSQTTHPGSDEALLDLSPEAPEIPPESSSSLLDDLWKESGLETSNFDPLDGKMEGLSMDSSDVTDKKDSPETPAAGALFDFSELDETEKGNMDFFAGEQPLQPLKLSTGEKSVAKDSLSGLRSFLPSQLLRKGWTSSQASTSSPSLVPKSETAAKAKEVKPMASASQQAWFNLFSDLDPLSNSSHELTKRTDGKEPDGSSC